ncbi:MAG: PAS domain S-box protein [Anaerolineales bacterium]
MRLSDDKTPHILVVDDDPAIVQATERLLKKAGYVTLSAHTGQQALDLARRHRPDLILLDINMPDMDGFEVCRRMKADPELAGIGILIVSSTYTDGESQASGLDLGADGYIARPITNRELLARVQVLLRARAAEQAARLHAAEWQATFDAVASAIFITDENFTIVKCNRTAETLFQRPSADIIGKKCYHLVHSTDAPLSACPLKIVRKDKRRHMLTFEQDGRWLEVSVDPILDAAGNFTGSVHVINDITERKQAEEALRASEERYRTLVETAGDVILLTDLEGRHLFRNSAYYTSLGFEVGEPVPLDGYARVHPDDAPALRASMNELLQKGELNTEYRVQHKDGHWVYRFARSRVIYDAEGRPQSVLAIIRDITERKQMEERIQAERDQAQRYLDIAGVILLILDTEARITLINRKGCEILGYDEDELLGRNWIETCLPIEERDEVARVFQNMLREEIKENGYHVNAILTKSGEERWISWHNVALTDKSGKLIGVLSSGEDITERKRAEEKLRQSEETYRNLFHNAQVGLFRTRISDGKILESNEQLARMFGYESREEFIAEYVTSQNYVDPGTRERMLELLRRDGSIQNFEARFYRKDRSIFWARYSARIYPEQGWIEGVAEDITEQKLAEEALRESEERLSRLIETVPSGITIVNRDGQITFANPAAEAILGLTRSKIEQRRYNDPDWRITAVDGSPFPDEELPFVRVMQSGQPVYDVEHAIEHPDGRRVILSINAAPLKDATGQVTGMIAAITDITARKKVEEALRESEEKLKSIFRVAPTGIGVVRDRILLEVNPKICEMTGYSPQELIGQSARILYPSQEEFEFVGREKYAQIAERGTGIVETRWQRKDGLVINILLASTPIDPDDLSKGVTFTALDITERKQAEEAIQRLNAELEARVEERTRQLKEAQEQLVRQEKLAVLGQLAGGVGHELRNPLAVISNAVYFLKLTLPEADAKVREYLDILERETRNAEKIISDLLDFARLKSVERTAIPVRELVRRVFERYPAPENVLVTLDLPPDLPPLWVDPRQMEQVLGNLMLNAYQAMPEGGRVSVISRQSSATDNQTPNTEHWPPNTEHWLLITVRDTGPGIPPENLPKLFEPLFTTKAHGIGLGLAVTKKLVEANGGRIQVESEPGQGAAFTLILPAAKEKK